MTACNGSQSVSHMAHSHRRTLNPVLLLAEFVINITDDSDRLIVLHNAFF